MYNEARCHLYRKAGCGGMLYAGAKSDAEEKCNVGSQPDGTSNIRLCESS